VRTLTALAEEGERLGAQVVYLTPDGFPTIPLPSYGHIRLALASPAAIARRIEAAAPDAIHIATEGPIGHLARRYCRQRGIRFTTSFHTRFPDYIAARLPIPPSWLWRGLRWFHGAAEAVMAATPALAAELKERGFRNVMLWPRGVDAQLFRPRPGADLGLKRPIFLTVGRLAVEKNLDAFLALDLPGSKVVVGDGPALARLKRRYPEARFLGNREGEALAQTYAAADVFVFPSRTDTFGLVLLEALASGLPVAAFPVCGPPPRRAACSGGPEPMGYVLYDYLPSGNGYKCRLTMKALGIPYELVQMDIVAGATRTPGFLAINPNGKVPVLVVPGRGPLAESHAIINFLAEGSKLMPQDAYGRGLVWQWLCFEQYQLEPGAATVRFWLKSLKKTPEEFGEIAAKVPDVR